MATVATTRRSIKARAYSPDTLETVLEAVLQRATARAALAAAYARGRDDRNWADQLAVEAMREVLDATLPVGAEVVIGEGERDDAPMLYIGERLGPHKDKLPLVHIAVDPLEGTNLCAHWAPGAICVIAATIVDEGSLWRGIDGYMDKLVVGQRVAQRLHVLRHGGNVGHPQGFYPVRPLLDQPIEVVMVFISQVTGKPLNTLVVEVLDRPRNHELIARLRALHVQVRLISDGDITAAWRALHDDHEVDVALGIGAAPEGVIAAAMANVLRGYMEGRCWFEDSARGQQQRARLVALGLDVEKLNTIDDLAAGHVMIAFTACTDSIVPGVVYGAGGIPHTCSVVGRSRTGTCYTIAGIHKNPPSPPHPWPNSV